jgi:hypothetical protein
MTAKIYLQQQVGPVSIDKLDELWGEILRQNWLESLDIHVVVRAARKWFSPLIEQTAYSLVQYLNENASYQRAKYCGPGSNLWITHPDFRNTRSVEEKIELNFRTASCCLRNGVPVTEDWLTPFFLVTVTGLGPDNYLRFSSILDAQAEMVALHPDHKRAMRLEMIYETHHLFRSDVCVVCGLISHHDIKQGTFWAMSNNDILLEVTLAKAAGLSPQSLTQICALSKHEMIDWEDVQLNGESLNLVGYTGSGLISWFSKFLEQIVHNVVDLLDEMRSLQRNSGRIMLAVRRRLNFNGKVE